MKTMLQLEKRSQRTLDREIISTQVKYAINRALGAGRGRVWAAGRPNIDEEQDNGSGYVYKASIKFQRTGRSTPDDVLERQWCKIQEIAEAAVRSKGWCLLGASPQTEKTETPGVEQVQRAGKAYAPLDVCIDPGQHFSHLYERDSQIEIILSSVREYVRSGFSNRFHAVLYGEPASGKTELLRSLTRMVGKGAVLHFDATSTTKAGAERVLLESADVPPILCIEEIEKTDEAALRWLLGVLDFRSEVRKVTHNRGIMVREVKLLCLATVNDFDLFRRLMDGALASRFSHKVWCPRPSRTVLEQILSREVEKAGGDKAWISPAIDWCVDQEHTNDPRRVITVCLSGRERLLDGGYQTHLKNTMPGG